MSLVAVVIEHHQPDYSIVPIIIIHVVPSSRSPPPRPHRHRRWCHYLQNGRRFRPAASMMPHAYF